MYDSVSFFNNGMTGKSFPTNPDLVRTGKASTHLGEMTPIVFKDRLLLTAVGLSWVPESPFKSGQLWIGDALTGETISCFGHGYGFANSIVSGDKVYVFAAKNKASSSGVKQVECFSSSDLQNWHQSIVMEAKPDELIFNQSVCKADGKYVMAFEVKNDSTVPFTIYFAESSDLQNWERLPDAIYGADRYAACPAIRYSDGWYYLFYLEHRTPRWWFEMCVARSRDLVSWQQSSNNPVLSPQDCELCNASDIDLVEYKGKVHAFYCYGNQKGMGCATSAVFEGPMQSFLNCYF
jgi:predicted GH43/DUF377 family glycosyl hydrolase